MNRFLSGLQFVCVMAALGIAGCSSSQEETVTTPAAGSAKAAAAPAKILTEAESEALIQEQARQAQAKSLPKPAQGTVVVEEQAPKPVAKKPQFPADLSQWTAENFRAARHTRNPRLIQAVRQLGRGNDMNSDAEANGRLLVELLKPVSLSHSAPSGSDEEEVISEGAPGTAMPGLADAIVDTLGVNGGSEARTALKNILLGKQPSELADRPLTTAALRALVAHFDEDNQRILAAVLTVPDSIRPPGRGQVTADQLQEEALRLVKPQATAEFRLHLAQRLSQRNCSAAARHRLLTMLTTAEPENVPAEVELLASKEIDSTMIVAVDRQLSQASQQTLDRLLHTKPQERVAESESKNESSDDVPQAPVHGGTSYDDMVRSARQLWRPDFGSELAARLDGTENLQTDMPLAILAASVPSETLRTMYARRWDKLWVEDAHVVETGALFSGGARDPGLLVVLKGLPREAPPSAKAHAAVKTSAKSGDATQAQRAAKEQSAKQAWYRISENFVRTFADRLAQTAEEQSRGGGLSGSARSPVASADEFDKLLETSTETQSSPSSSKSTQIDALLGELDLSLHQGASIKGAYRLDWPTDFDGRLADTTISPLVVRYLRLESESEINSVVVFYQKQLKTSVVRTTDKGFWIDAVLKLDDGHARSVDVLITRADAGSSAARNGAGRLIVDILSVEVPDPRQAPAADEPHSASTRIVPSERRL